MPLIVKVLVLLACLSLGVVSVAPGLISNAQDGIASILHSLESEFCSSSLLGLRFPLSTLQCRKTSTYATSHASTEDLQPEETSSSGGWSGPHACAGSYCVYSNPTFAANRGISIISDADTANTLANLPIFKDLASPQAGDLLASANINTKSEGFETKDIPNKGRGFVASRPIHRGEQVLAYTPSVVIHRSFVDDLSRGDQLRLLREAVRFLPAHSRAMFWKQLGQTHEADDNDILDIIMNNSFNLPLSLPSGATFIGNFPEVSMYNHDCRPNVAFHLDHGLVHRTHAVRTVGAGEELVISYVDSYRAREVRRARTRRNWGFECACAQCMLPPALANASDHRLWRIWEVENSLWLGEEAEMGEHRKGKGDVLDRVELLLSLYQQERLLDSHGAVAYKTAALNYNALGRKTLAVKYSLLALEAFIVEDGASSGGTRDVLALLDDPERHWSWKRNA